MRRLLVVTVCAAFVISGCQTNLIKPLGPAPLRYRDTIFTTVTKISNVTYGSAVDQQGQTVGARTRRPTAWTRPGSRSGVPRPARSPR